MVARKGIMLKVGKENFCFSFPSFYLLVSTPPSIHSVSIRETTCDNAYGITNDQIVVFFRLFFSFAEWPFMCGRRYIFYCICRRFYATFRFCCGDMTRINLVSLRCEINNKSAQNVHMYATFFLLWHEKTSPKMYGQCFFYYSTRVMKGVKSIKSGRSWN